MSPAEHYGEAERLLALAESGAVVREAAFMFMGMAQVHATLALYRGQEP